ncbi:MAG: deoxyribodipyrimidine photo-lyase [Sulfurospirillaceae bacterium]|nr:deoxyribodipyrimidine photo-lyase [Sulfurospirillaceae bacterium]
MKKILWFRRDLRVEDSMLLAQNGEVLPIFIFDKYILDSLPHEDRRVDFIFNAVMKLKSDLKKIGLNLAIFYGKPEEIFEYLKNEGYHEVYASIDYDAYARERDAKIAHILTFHPLHDTYIFEPNEILKKDGTPYLVFTPYYHACQAVYTKFHALSYIKGEQTLASFNYDYILSFKDNTYVALAISLENIGFTSLRVTYHEPRKVLQALHLKMDNYAVQRDFLALDATSHLSIHLRFGTLSIRHILRYLTQLKREGKQTEPFFRQLVFRDFYAYLLFHFPSLASKNYKYDMPVRMEETYFQAFCTAQTGYPLIDAAITELLKTGLMHNRARMITGSFFTKHLRLPWQDGEAFFAKHLLDYDASANILSWQWCAGTGIDPQPYFRIFNPYTQSKKFDANAMYIKRWLPFLKEVPSQILHNEQKVLNLNIAGYPKPIVTHENARKTFLALCQR